MQLAYLLVNIAYSFGLKNIAILDIVIVSSGFLIRVFIGSYVTDIKLSSWIELMTFLLALLMVLGKRRDDILLLKETGVKARKSLDGYTEDFLNHAILLVATAASVSYIQYTLSDEVIKRFNQENLYITSFFVIIAILKYLQLIFVYNNSGYPVETLYKSKFLQVTVLLWVLSFGLLIYYDKFGL
ncbi:MAG: phosphoribose diphosphate--decaprenyl-phosphate phosphoribosyltransferase [Candidatus Dojkabacteria bacterium]|nr:phosphoribose diphosphate--decaprenyl-phosphate phosphoribosyltransferase [Candidatus Dojkabacteria bacterium]